MMRLMLESPLHFQRPNLWTKFSKKQWMAIWKYMEYDCVFANSYDHLYSSVNKVNIYLLKWTRLASIV